MLLFLLRIILIYLHVRNSPFFHFIICALQRSVPTACRPGCPSTLASRKGKCSETDSSLENTFLCHGSDNSFKSFHLPRWAAVLPKINFPTMIFYDLFYIIFFFHLFSCGKAVLFGKGVSRQVFITSSPVLYLSHTHILSFSTLLHFWISVCSLAIGYLTFYNSTGWPVTSETCLVLFSIETLHYWPTSMRHTTLHSHVDKK